MSQHVDHNQQRAQALLNEYEVSCRNLAAFVDANAAIIEQYRALLGAKEEGELRIKNELHRSYGGQTSFGGGKTVTVARTNLFRITVTATEKTGYFEPSKLAPELLLPTTVLKVDTKAIRVLAPTLGLDPHPAWVPPTPGTPAVSIKRND